MDIYRYFTQFIRGAVGAPPWVPSALRQLQASEFEWEPWNTERTKDRGIFFGGVRFPVGLEGHIKVFGTTRSGKTTVLRLLMMDALHDLLDPTSNTRALIYDPKRDMPGVLAGMGLANVTVTLDPRRVDSHALHWPSLVRDLEGAKRIAAALVPMTNSADSSPYFHHALRALIKSIILALIDLHEQTGFNWSLRTVLNVLEKEALVRQVCSRHHEGRGDIDAYLDGRSDTKLDLRGVTRNFLSDYAILGNLWHHAQEEGRVVSIDEWLRSNQILILPAPPPSDDDNPDDPVSQLNRVIFGLIAERLLVQSEARRQKTPQRVWLIIDEFRFAGKLPGLLSLFTTGASFGVRVVVGVHNLSGLQDALGVQKADEVLDLCSIKAFLRAGNADTAATMAAQFGKIRDFVKNGNSFAETDRPVLLDSDFLNLPLPRYEPEQNIITDLSGYYRVPGVTAPRPATFFSTLPVTRLYGPHGIISSVSPGYEFRARPPEQQRHVPFTTEELAALRGERPIVLNDHRPIVRGARLARGATKGLFLPTGDPK